MAVWHADVRSGDVDTSAPGINGSAGARFSVYEEYGDANQVKRPTVFCCASVALWRGGNNLVFCSVMSA